MVNRIRMAIAALMIATLSITAQTDYAAEYQKKYEENIQKTEINGVYIPVDIDDAFLQLDKLSDAAARAKMIEAPEDIVAERLTRGLGKWMIVNWNFYEGSRLSHYLKEKGVAHPDDMAQYLVVSYYRYLKNLPQEYDTRAEAIEKRRKAEQEQKNAKKVVLKNG